MSKLRDKFATSAMQSLLSAYGGEISPKQVAIVAYMVADEMLRERTAPTAVAAPVPVPAPAPTPSLAEEQRCEAGPHPDDVGLLAFSPRTLDGLPVRALNALDRGHVWTIGALTRLTAGDLGSRRFRGIGPGAVDQVRQALAAKGLSLAGETTP